MDDRDPAFRHIVDNLRTLGVYRPQGGGPTLPPDNGDGKPEPMGPQPRADLEPRVSRLELGFCGAFVLIFAAIIASYLLLSGGLDRARDRDENTQAQIAAVTADVKVLNERTVNMDKKLDAILAKK